MRSRVGLMAACVAVLGSVCAAPQAEVGEVKVIHRAEGRYVGWPTACRLANGDILAVYSGNRKGHVCPYGRVELVRSSDGGETWSKPVVIAKTPLDDRDAGIVQLPDGKLLVTFFNSLAFMLKCYRTGAYRYDIPESEYAEWDRLYARAGGEKAKSICGNYAVWSRDRGRTWTKPKMLPSEYAQSPHGPIVLKNGSLLQIGAVDNGGAYGGRIAVSQSRDGGRSWKVLNPELPRVEEEKSKQHSFVEPQVVENPDGSLVAMVRYHGPNAYRVAEHLHTSISKDGGKTWSPMTKTQINGYPPHLLRLKDGRIVCTYARRLKEYGFGEFAVVSSDGGVSWGEEICLAKGVSDDLGYPSTVELPGGRLLTVFYQQMSAGEKTSLAVVRWRLAPRQ